MRAQHLGEDGDGVVALEGDEGGLLAQPLAQRRPDPGAERAEVFGQVAQERDPGAVLAQQRRPVGEFRLPRRSTDQDPGQAPVPADGPDDRHRRVGVAGQEQERGRAVGGQLLADALGGEGAQVEFDEGAAARRDPVPEDAGPGGPVDARVGRHGDPAVARAEKEVGVDGPPVRLCRGDAGDPFGRPVGERVEHRGGAQEGQAEGLGPGGRGARDHAVVLPRQGGHPQTGEFLHGRLGPAGIGGGVADHELDGPAGDPPGLVDLARGQVESGEQVPARPDPAGAGQRHEGPDPDGRSVGGRGPVRPVRPVRPVLRVLPVRVRWCVHAAVSPRDQLGGS